MCRPGSRDEPFEFTAATGGCMSRLARAHPYACTVLILKKERKKGKQTNSDHKIIWTFWYLFNLKDIDIMQAHFGI